MQQKHITTQNKNILIYNRVGHLLLCPLANVAGGFQNQPASQKTFFLADE